MTEAENYALGLLVEEMAEVAKHAGKALRFGIDTPGHLTNGVVDGETPRTMLPAEIGDVLAAIKYAIMAGLLDKSVFDHAQIKLNKLLDPEAKDNLGRRLAPAIPGGN